MSTLPLQIAAASEDKSKAVESCVAAGQRTLKNVKTRRSSQTPCAFKPHVLFLWQ